MTGSPRSSFQWPNFSPLPPRTEDEANLELISSLPDLIRFNSEKNPEHIFCIQAQTAHAQRNGRGSGAGAYSGCSITFRQLDDAIGLCTNQLSTLVGFKVGIDDPQAHPPVALYLESDVGLFFYLASLLTLDITVLLISARLSAASVQHLLEKTRCETVLVSKRTASLLDGHIDSRFHIKTVEPYTRFIPIRDTNGQREDGVVDVHDKTGSGSARQGWLGDTNRKDRRSLILHSSGTTGFPKPIFLSKRYPLLYAACHQFAAHEHIDWANLSTLPLYHGFGFLAPCLSLSTGMTCVFPPSSIIPAGQSTFELLETFGCQSLMTVPSIIDDVLAIDGALERLATLKFLAVGGGALNPEQGVILKAHGVSLLNHYGVTEIGPIAPIFRPGPDYNWRYLRLRSDTDLELRPIPGSTHFKLVGFPIGWNETFEVQDELERNPDSVSEHTEIRILGRVDDLIVLKTGEKVMPQYLEAALNADPFIKTAVCIGQGFFEVAVLIEPSELGKTQVSEAGHKNLIDRVWNSISATNPSLDSHARVSSRKAIIIKPPHKDIPRTDKGSVSRRLVHEVFANEIAAAYAAMDEDISKDGSITHILSLNDMEFGIRQMVGDVFANSQYLDASQDMFEQGMDSLQALRLARAITAAVKKSSSSDWQSSTNGAGGNLRITPEFIYRNPSIEMLAAAVKRLINSGESAPTGTLERHEEMTVTAERFISNIERIGCQHPPIGKDSRVVLLTGATGSLGVHVLSCLVKSGSVSKVICLYRRGQPKKEALSRQEATLSAAGLVLEEGHWSKIDLVEDMEFLRRYHQEKDGSAKDGHDSVFSRLADEVTDVVHLAWPMDFHRTLQSFESHMQMVEALIGLARIKHSRSLPKTKPRVRLLFSSSIAAVRNYKGQNTGLLSSSRKHVRYVPGAVPELAMESPTAPAAIGYAEAKWVCEHMLRYAGNSFSQEIEPVVVRIGQLSGAQNSPGLWKMGEHVPALVKASRVVGAFPQLKGTLSWLPVDRAARSLIEILFHPSELGGFLHLENPVRQPARDVTAIMAYELGISCSMIPFEEWLERASKLGILSSLAEFFEGDFQDLALGSVVLDTTKSRSLSRTLRESGGINKELLIGYIRRWKSEGLFN